MPDIFRCCVLDPALSLPGSEWGGLSVELRFSLFLLKMLLILLAMADAGCFLPGANEARRVIDVYGALGSEALDHEILNNNSHPLRQCPEFVSQHSKGTSNEHKGTLSSWQKLPSILIHYA